MNRRRLLREAALAPLGLALLGSNRLARARGAGRDDGWRPLFNGRNLEGWSFRSPDAPRVWVVCSDVTLDPANPGRFLPVGEGGTPDAVLLCGGDGRGSDLMTVEPFQDYELHVEFTVPNGSNSGVYNRGLFEVQVFDSYGKPALDVHDCGALYERAIPPKNLSTPPGAWQTYDITMKGKTLSLTWNGEQVFDAIDVRYGATDREAFERLNAENASKPPELRVKLEEKDGTYRGFFGEGATRAGLDGPDRPGPILLQGDHGPVAYRNLRIRPL